MYEEVIHSFEGLSFLVSSLAFGERDHADRSGHWPTVKHWLTSSVALTFWHFAFLSQDSRSMMPSPRSLLSLDELGWGRIQNQVGYTTMERIRLLTLEADRGALERL